MSRESRRQERIAVIGAGIAGLCSGYFLKKHGFDVTVFEAGARVGGRMSTDRVGDCLIDRGAQFLSESYRTLLPLIQEVGLGSTLNVVSPFAAVVRGKKIRCVTPSNPLSVLTSGYLKPREALRLAWRSAWIKRHFGSLPLDDYAAWSHWDDALSADFIRRNFGEGILEYVIEPQLQGFYFQTPEESSKALALMLLSFMVKKGRVLSLANGMGSLPERLASRLDVRVSSPIRSIEVDDSGVSVFLEDSVVRVDKVVLAVTASAARSIYRQATVLEKSAMDVSYSSAINIGLATTSKFRLAPQLRDVYGLIIPRLERGIIAGIGIESNKSKDRIKEGELFDFMLEGETSSLLMGRSDQEILQRCLPELETYASGVSDSMRTCHIVRWNEAEPKSPVGRSRNIQRYRESLDRRARVVLAGDYMGFPYTDSAAFTGKRSADFIAGKGISTSSMV
jgi:oxygen-dependent protoporphyrinogen oxidase